MNGTYALVVLIYGICLTTAAAIWMHHLGEPWRRVLKTLGVFIAFVVLLSPVSALFNFLSGLGDAWAVLWMVPVEEALKLALIVRLGASGRRAIAICLLFGCFEVVAAKAPLMLAMPVSIPLSALLISITYAVVMHAATGLVYARIGRASRLWLFAMATLLHLLNNAASLYTMLHADGPWTAVAMGACALGIVLAGMVGFREATRYLLPREAAAPSEARETLAPTPPLV